jgi:outer membrane protein with beta-barrel domain
MKRSVLVFLFTLNAAAIAVGQPISVGVLGGVPFIDQTQTFGNDHDESRPYIVGPSVEVRLPAGFALEADGLYQRIGGTFGFQLLDSSAVIPVGTTTIAVTASTNRARANLWEFPVLGKYYFRRDSAWQPFVGTGFAFRTAGFHEAGTETLLNNGVSNLFRTADNFRSDLEVGATFAAGFRYRMGHFALQPQVRYTRWGGSNGVLRHDEAAFFLGLAF